MSSAFRFSAASAVHRIPYKKLLNTILNCGNIERYMNKFMEEALKEEYDGAYEIRYVDVDANQDLVDTYNVGGIPVVVIFRNGKEVLRFNGEMDYDDLCDILDRPLG